MAYSIAYSAPAKVILSGEHSAVFGRPALISAVNLRMKVMIRQGKIDPSQKKVIEMSKRIKSWLKKNNIPYKDQNFDFKTVSEIPRGGGFGSSAALSVAISAGLLEFYTGKQFSKKEVNEVAYECEKIFHGSPSGIDNTTCTFGGLVFYRKEFEFLKVLSNLEFGIPEYIQKNLILIDSGKRAEDTKELVRSVVNRMEQNPAKTSKILHNIEKSTKKITEAIHEDQLDLLTISISKNQKFLNQIGVVSRNTRNLLYELDRFGTGKITGAGGQKNGSGFLLFLCKEGKKEAIKDYLNKKSILHFDFIQDFEGVRKEEI
jgi:mevalonate kinase